MSKRVPTITNKPIRKIKICINNGLIFPANSANGLLKNTFNYPLSPNVFSIDVKIDQLLYVGQFFTAF